METLKFNELNISPEIFRGVKDMGFEEASPIQSKAIPIAMAGADIIGQAQTGTGKTAAFGIPVLEKVKKEIKHPQTLILCPTRELAVQAAEEIRKLAKYMHGVKVLPIYGGQDITKQIRALKGTQIIIGTPGRVMDHLRRKTIRCDYVDTIVLDEADEMLNMGFREDIETVLTYIPNKDRQTILFSATMPQAILDITKNYQKPDAKMIKVVKKELTVPVIEQYYLDVKRKDKVEVLCRLLDYYEPKLSLVFCNTKKMVDDLTEILKGRGYFAEGLHGDMSQAQRDRVMKSFRDGKTDILIATDVAARGIDVDDVEAVFNYDIPQDDEYYVHRIGRTGRAGRTGRSFTFVKGKEVYKLKDIMRYCKTKIYAMPVPSLNDVNQIKIEKVMDKIGNVIEEEDLTSMINTIQKQINESDYTAMDIAAAFLKMYMGQPNDNNDPNAEYAFDNTGAEEEGMARLFINIGKAQKVKAKDILGAIAGEANIPGKLVGAIDLYDKYTFVEVPKENAAEVLAAMKNVKIKGKMINIEPANAK
ncbi:DEAD-box ATP-dependent RNA helicase CshA [Lachnospiraceae bacterium]|nr:DEAD-box ATP-dependent RNA helicase CshA [Lachnospiraceae bacterium]